MDSIVCKLQSTIPVLENERKVATSRILYCNPRPGPCTGSILVIVGDRESIPREENMDLIRNSYADHSEYYACLVLREYRR